MQGFLNHAITIYEVLMVLGVLGLGWIVLYIFGDLLINMWKH